MTNDSTPESIFSNTESYDDKVNRLKEVPKVVRMARFHAELKGKEWGYSFITTVGLPIEGTDMVRQIELTKEEVQQLVHQVEAALIEYCEGDRGAALFVAGLAHDQLVQEELGE